jgi:hypothetical protein
MPEEFKKDDSAKNRLELVDYKFVEGIGEILTFGAEKYAAWNWQKASSDEDRERLKGAMMRHAMAYMNGEKVDPESGKSHLYHMGCCQMFLDYFDRKDLKALNALKVKLEIDLRSMQL